MFLENWCVNDLLESLKSNDLAELSDTVSSLPACFASLSSLLPPPVVWRPSPPPCSPKGVVASCPETCPLIFLSRLSSLLHRCVCMTLAHTPVKSQMQVGTLSQVEAHGKLNGICYVFYGANNLTTCKIYFCAFSLLSVRKANTSWSKNDVDRVTETGQKLKKKVISVPTRTVALIIQDYQECRSSSVTFHQNPLKNWIHLNNLYWI